MPKIKLNWIDPLQLAQESVAYFAAENLAEDDFIFLNSGLNSQIKKSRSYLAFFPEEKIISNNFADAEKIVKSSSKKWFGYLSYELGQDFEKLPKTSPSHINLAKIHLLNFALILEFDHDKKTISAQFSNAKIWQKFSQFLANFQSVHKASKSINSKLRDNLEEKLSVTEIDSNFTDKSYLKAIEEIKEKIAAGDFYQTNLTRKFFGKFDKNISNFSAFFLFKNLNQISPANYSSLLKLSGNFIISSSPELFLFAKNRKIISRPIKGTAARNSEANIDLRNKIELKNSVKERAENLMIVDLVRNDLSRICQAGSVKVKKIFHIDSYATVHHMSSEISGKISSEFCAFDALKTSFPPGSMTGAPKIKAMEVAAQKEKIDRGIYSGAIGLVANNQLNLSVVIRTLIISQNKFEFQVGGAITFDSKAELELQEIFNKAQGILRLLNLEKIVKKIS